MVASLHRRGRVDSKTFRAERNALLYVVFLQWVEWVNSKAYHAELEASHPQFAMPFARTFIGNALGAQTAALVGGAVAELRRRGFERAVLKRGWSYAPAPLRTCCRNAFFARSLARLKAHTAAVCPLRAGRCLAGGGLATESRSVSSTRCPTTTQRGV
jgi:hypothetical protein